MYMIFQGQVNKTSSKDPEKVLKLIKEIFRDPLTSSEILPKSLSKVLEDPYRSLNP